MSFALPQLGVTQTAALRSDARKLAASIEWARTQAAVTGKPHLVRLDLPNGSYRVEWRATEAEVAGEPPPWPPPLEPEIGVFQPVPRPAELGRWGFLDDQLDFQGVQLDGELITEGDVELLFEPDGSTEPAEISIVAPADGRAIALEVRAMVDAVRIFYPEA